MSLALDPEHLRLLLEKTGAIPWKADAKTWMFTYVGPQAEKLLGYLIERWYEKDFWVSHLHPDDREYAVDFCLKSSSRLTNYYFEYRMKAADGRIVWVHDIVHVVVKDGAPDSLLGFLIDVTDRKWAEEALRQSEERCRTLAESATDVIITIDHNSTILFVNSAVAKVFGYPPSELIGQKITVLIPEPLRQRHEEGLRRYLERGEKTLSWDAVSFPGRHKSGREISLEISFAESRIGDRLSFTGIMRDVTERKQAELEMVQQRAELAHIARVSTMGILAASLAHELNQPLTAILSNAQAAQRFLVANPPVLEEVREILNDIVQDNRRAGEVIRRMRALARKEKLEFASLDLPSVIGDVVLLIRREASLHNIRVSLKPSPGLPPVRGDNIQLQQVAFNLLLNAFDAMTDCPANERQVEVGAELDGGSMVRVAVRDRGAGLSGDKLDTIFQPFYTTKRDGLGLGLSISRSIIEAHGGRLWAESNPDRGATFYFTVPVMEGESKE